MQQSDRPFVLVVEDEPLLRMDAADMVRAAGFHVIEATNADEAIAILESRDDIRILFTDIQMPGSMDGIKLAHAVRGRWPPIAIIATSGQLRLEADDLPSGGHFLSKPYSAPQIARALQHVLS